jgi:hypothetical protein
MNLLSILHIIAAAGTILTGLFALIKPTAVYGFTGLSASGVRGVSEIRAFFGGLLIAMGAAPFFLGGPAYQILGINYLGIAAARLFSILFDRSTEQSNLISLAIEIVFGIILVI